MSKSVGSFFAAVCFVGLASTAHAANISMCVPDADNAFVLCDLYEADANGNPQEYGDVANPFVDWLTGVTFVLDPGGVYDGTPGSVSDIVIIHAGHAELYSQGWAGDALTSSFFDVFVDITSFSPDPPEVDGAPVEQVVGQPLFLGANQVDGIGLVFEDQNGLAQLFPVCFGEGCGDTINIHSDAEVAPIPEPATLTLVGLGGLAALRRRRKATV